VVGNQLFDGNDQVVHLHGVNYSGTEFACIQGWGIFDGPSDDAMVQALTTWHVNVVHIGLNEDCILDINGVDGQYAGANYMNAIVAFVNRLHAHGLYAEVSLMWAAPGSEQAQDHPPILDADHAPAALAAIANAFSGDPNTFIGLQSEPHDISWACWQNGGSSCSVGYTALGMQGALAAIRATGATNIVTASGIDWANNLSQWLSHEPVDPLGQLMAEAHVYGGNTCDNTSCFDTNYAPVAAVVPMVWGETGESYDAGDCGTGNMEDFLPWADAHGVNYEPWTWNTWGTCLSLIDDFDGTPHGDYGTWIRDYYLAHW
jgi:endoglucanase